MNWEEALKLIVLHIVVGLHLDPQSPYRFVIEGPNYNCNGYDGENGYRVSIGENQFIEIPFSMLENLYVATINNNNIYK